MPYVAVDQNGWRVDITQFGDPREELRDLDLKCQLCGGQMLIKAGRIVRPHFAHRNLCPYRAETEPETSEHVEGKEWVKTLLLQFWDDLGIIDVLYEFHVAEVGRIVDVAALFPSGWAIGCEVQLSGITTEHLERRSRDYLDSGIEPIWFLGRDANKETNRKWCADNLGFGFSLEFPCAAEGTIAALPFCTCGKPHGLRDWIKHLAILRALELWQPLAVDELSRACCMTSLAAKKSLAGLLGTMNVACIGNRGKGCIEQKDKRWSLIESGIPWPWYKTDPLSPHAKARAKKRARERAALRRDGTSVLGTAISQA